MWMRPGSNVEVKRFTVFINVFLCIAGNGDLPLGSFQCLFSLWIDGGSCWDAISLM